MSIKEGYTRVSAILSQWDRFGHIDQEIVARKADIGTEVHDAIKADYEGIYRPLSEKAEPYFESFLSWQKESKVVFSDVEQRLYDDALKITGAMDAIAVFPGSSERVLIDFKTSANEDKKFWPLQAGFYSMLARANQIDISNRVVFVKLSRDGSLPKVCEYIIDDQILLVCMSALNTYRYINS